MNFKEKLKLLFEHKNNFLNNLFILFLANNNLYKRIIQLLLLFTIMIISCKILNYNILMYILSAIHITLSVFIIISSIFYKFKNKLRYRSRNHHIDYNDNDNLYYELKLEYMKISVDLYMYNSYIRYRKDYFVDEFYKNHYIINKLNVYDVIYDIKDTIFSIDLTNLRLEDREYIKKYIRKSISYKRKSKIKNIN